MPSHNFDLNDSKNILRLLLALTIQNEGELRIKGVTFDSIDRGRLLLIDYDPKKADIVIRATSDLGRVAVVPPENAGWAKPAETAPLERSRADAAVAASRRKVPTDEDMARLEEDAMRVQELARADAEGKTPLRIRTV
jgi:hypothetical protein